MNAVPLDSGPPSRDGVETTIDPALRHVLEGIARGHLDHDPVEIHPLKMRPGRHDSRFIGRCMPSPLGMVVAWGVVIKRATPRRAAELLALHEELGRALAHGRDMPAVPRVAIARPRDGWIALEAWPGTMMAGDPDPTRRAGHAARVAQRLAALERSRAARRWWPVRRWSADDEARRLREAWEQAGEALPPAAADVMDRLGLARPGLVPAHCDLDAEHVIVDLSAPAPDGEAGHWIDWDHAALAPPGLDLGNLLAHERLAALLVDGTGSVEFESLRWGALAGYLEAGGRATPLDLAAWEAAACLRLAALSLQRARGDDAVMRNPAWLPAPSARRAEADKLRRAAEGVFAAARAAG